MGGVLSFYNNYTHKEQMTEFSQKRFVDLGQSIYIEWLKNMENASSVTGEKRREVFKLGAEVAFEAAEEFAKVFRQQEDTV
jgi:hypothetical protein